MRRVNLSLSDSDYLKIERWARYNRMAVGSVARTWLMWIIETKLHEEMKSGRLEQFEQLTLFDKPKSKGGER